MSLVIALQPFNAFRDRSMFFDMGGDRFCEGRDLDSMPKEPQTVHCYGQAGRCPIGGRVGYAVVGDGHETVVFLLTENGSRKLGDGSGVGVGFYLLFVAVFFLKVDGMHRLYVEFGLVRALHRVLQALRLLPHSTYPTFVLDRLMRALRGFCA